MKDQNLLKWLLNISSLAGLIDIIIKFGKWLAGIIIKFEKWLAGRDWFNKRNLKTGLVLLVRSALITVLVAIGGKNLMALFAPTSSHELVADSTPIPSQESAMLSTPIPSQESAVPSTPAPTQKPVSQSAYVLRTVSDGTKRKIPLDEMSSDDIDFHEGDDIYTFDQPATISLGNGQEVSIDPNSLISLTKLHQDGTDGCETLISVDFGCMIYDVQSNPNDELFAARTPDETDGTLTWSGVEAYLLGTVAGISYDRVTGSSNVYFLQHYGVVKNIQNNTYRLVIEGQDITKEPGDPTLQLHSVDLVNPPNKIILQYLLVS